MKILPSPQQVVSDAIALVAVALVAAVIVSQVPSVRDWIKRELGGIPGGL